MNLIVKTVLSPNPPIRGDSRPLASLKKTTPSKPIGNKRTRTRGIRPFVPFANFIGITSWESRIVGRKFYREKHTTPTRATDASIRATLYLTLSSSVVVPTYPLRHTTRERSALQPSFPRAWTFLSSRAKVLFNSTCGLSLAGWDALRFFVLLTARII